MATMRVALGPRHAHFARCLVGMGQALQGKGLPIEAHEQLSLGLDIIREAHGRLESTAGGNSSDVRAEGANAQEPHLDVCLAEMAVGSNYLTWGESHIAILSYDLVLY